MYAYVKGNIETYCPNAFWNGKYIFFCEGMDVEDIAYHEWTHGTSPILSHRSQNHV